MQRPELWEKVRTVIRLPAFNKVKQKVLPPIKLDTAPSPVKILSREDLIDWCEDIERRVNKERSRRKNL